MKLDLLEDIVFFKDETRDQEGRISSLEDIDWDKYDEPITELMCREVGLINLKGCPDTVKVLDCSGNEDMESLEGCPKSVEHLVCLETFPIEEYGQIPSHLAPDEIECDYYCDENSFEQIDITMAWSTFPPEWIEYILESKLDDLYNEKVDFLRDFFIKTMVASSWHNDKNDD